MNWDLSEQFEPMQASTPSGREIVPVGRHMMRIKFAEERAVPFKASDDNPDGMCLSLRLADIDGRYQIVFDDLPNTRSLAWRASQLAAAVGMATGGETLSIGPDDVLDRVVEVDVTHYTKRDGSAKPQVKAYRKAESQPKAVAKTRTQAARVTEMLDDDVVPF
jgi:hypothetical protein